MPGRSKPLSVLDNASWNAAGTLLNIILSLVLAPLLIERLGVDQWGLLLLVWSFSGVLAVANFGLGEASLRFIARHHAEGDLAAVNRVLAATLAYYVSICSLVTCVLWVAAPTVAQWVKVPGGQTDQTEWLIRLAALLFSVGMLANAFRTIPMALHRYDVTNKVGSVQSIMRSVGLVLLVLIGLGVFHLVVWELLVGCVGLVVHVAVARRMLPGVRCLPGLSLTGMREIIGYSLFSFATHVFLTIWREGPRLMLGSRIGTASVAYLGTPDNVSGRLHSIVVSAVETLVPRFSAPRAEENDRMLLMMATWSAFAYSAILYVPLAVLMPDFLRLWINPEFAGHSGAVGQVLTLSLIAPTGYAAIAALFRGIGKPAFVTAVMAAAAGVVLAGSALLMPSLGALGVAWAYLIGAVAWFAGIVHGWLWLYGRGSLPALARVAGLPLVVAAGLFFAQLGLRNWWGTPGWLGLFLMGAVFAALGAATLAGCDILLGGKSPARLALARLLGSGPFAALRNRLGLVRGQVP